MTRIPLTLIAACLGLACNTTVPPAREAWEAVATVPPERKVCGWETNSETPLAITAAGQTRALAGDSVIVITVAPDAPYGAVQDALKPAEESLIRVKLVVDERWLLPTTFPQKRRQPPKPPPEHRATRIVGRRQITRDTRRPAERFAALRVSGDRVMLFIENENQAGKEHAVSELRAVLAAIEPRPDVFALTATADTPWNHVQAAVLAAACYDRSPGDEPHEIILD
jgi:hypothetical protein